jgi:hypothetical protein
MPLLSRLLLPLLLALSMTHATAAPPTPDRYTAEVAVTGTDAAQRDEAIARALREVVVKVSGDPKSVARLRAVRDPSELVAQYQYAGATGGGRALRVTFDRQAIDALLSDEPAAAAAAAPVAASAPSAAPGERFRVQVRGIDSLAKQARVMRLFQGAAGADAVALRAARGDLVLFELTGRAGPEQIDRVAREGSLEPDSGVGVPAGAPGAGASGSSDGTRLRYRVMQ